jgi:hypothetical protein
VLLCHCHCRCYSTPPLISSRTWAGLALPFLAGAFLAISRHVSFAPGLDPIFLTLTLHPPSSYSTLFLLAVFSFFTFFYLVSSLRKSRSFFSLIVYIHESYSFLFAARRETLTLNLFLGNSTRYEKRREKKQLIKDNPRRTTNLR